MPLLVLVLSLLLSAAPLSAAPPTDEQVDAAIAALLKRVEGKVPPALFEERAKGIHELVGALGVKELTLAQIEKLKNAGMLTDPTMRDDLMDRLTHLAEDQGAQGALAAVLRMDFVSPDPDAATTPEQKALGRQALGEAAVTALMHPGIRAAWDGGKGFDAITRLYKSNPAPLGKPAAVDALEKALAPGASTEVIRRIPTLMEAVGSEAAGLKPEQIERIRVRAEALVSEFKTTGEQDERSIAILKRFIGGAMCRGSLLGKPAPALEFTWTPPPPDGSNSPAPKSIADLKGKVAVLIFWHAQANTANRCILGANALKIRYKDSPVEVILVTGLQGRATDYTDPKQPKKYDTSKDPQREYELTAQLLKRRGSTSQLAFCSELYNVDFGVVRVPVVAVIDPAGVVRLRTGDIREYFNDVCARLDEVLDEFKLPKPPPGPVEFQPPAPAATGAAPAGAPPPAPVPAGQDAPPPDKGG